MGKKPRRGERDRRIETYRWTGWSVHAYTCTVRCSTTKYSPSGGGRTIRHVCLYRRCTGVTRGGGAPTARMLRKCTLRTTSLRVVETGCPPSANLESFHDYASISRENACRPPAATLLLCLPNLFGGERWIPILISLPASRGISWNLAARGVEGNADRIGRDGGGRWIMRRMKSNPRFLRLRYQGLFSGDKRPCIYARGRSFLIGGRSS